MLKIDGYHIYDNSQYTNVKSHAVQVLKFYFLKKWDIICLQMMCYSNLAHTHVRDISACSLQEGADPLF